MRNFTLILSLLFLGTNLRAGEVIDTKELQQFQQDFDDKYFEIHHGFEKMRHTLLHLMKSTGRIASYCEAKEHGKEPDTTQLLDEAVPDLLIYALEIANLYNVDLGEKYDKRLQALKEGALKERPYVQKGQ